MDTTMFTSAKDAALRGETYRERGNYSSAIACFTRALELHPEYAYAYAHRGAAWGALAQIEKARADFDRAVELSPDVAQACRTQQPREARAASGLALLPRGRLTQRGANPS